MKKIINILLLIFGLIIAVIGFFIADHYSPSLGLSGLPKTIFLFAGALPGIALLLIFDGGYQKNLHWLLKPVPASVWVWRVIGAIVAIAGGGLVIGNRTGQFLTFPYAGSIVMVIGVLIVSFKGNSN